MRATSRMTPHLTIHVRMLFTILWAALGVFVFTWYPMSSVFHQPTTQRIVLASGFFVCVVLNIVWLWIKPKSSFFSDILDRGLGWLGLILLLLYFSS